jgi:hypothetical protein
MLSFLALCALHQPCPRLRKPRHKLPITQRYKRKGQP